MEFHKKASMDYLSHMHAVLAQKMLERLVAVEPVMHMTTEGLVPTGVMQSVATNQDWGQVIKFLKDNSCIQTIHTSEGIAALDQELRKSKKRSETGIVRLVPPQQAASNGN